MDLNVIKKYRAWRLNHAQQKINKEFEEHGLTDELLDKQIELNIRRNKYNIPDKENVDEEGWSQ